MQHGALSIGLQKPKVPLQLSEHRFAWLQAFEQHSELAVQLLSFGVFVQGAPTSIKPPSLAPSPALASPERLASAGMPESSAASSPASPPSTASA